MEELNPDIFVVKSNYAPLDIVEQLKTHNCNSIINKVITNQALVSLFELDPARYNSYEKLCLLNLPSLQNPFLIGSKLNQTDGKKTKFEFNLEFTKLLTLAKPLAQSEDKNNIKQNIFNNSEITRSEVSTIDTLLKHTRFLTIDISKPNLEMVLHSNNIELSQMIKTTRKIDQKPINLNEFRMKYVDRITFYKINGHFLLVGFSRKAKERKRLFEYNNGFIQYLTAIPSYDNPIPTFKFESPEALNKNDKNSTLELDRILDKIALHGMDSLSNREKVFLKAW